MLVGKIKFPIISHIKCNMMPFIQGDSSSLPEIYQSYSEIIDEVYLEKGEIGYLTIDESFVQAGESQRGYNAFKERRNVHVEVGRNKKYNFWGPSWGGHANTFLDTNTMVLIANSVSDTCRYWNIKEMAYTKDGDLSRYLDKYPENTGILLKSGEVAKISIFTPHECIRQKMSSYRQFFRIVGKGVRGREEYFTINPKIKKELL